MFDEEEYKDLINKSLSLGMRPSQYLRMLCRPCQSCGGDKVYFDKLQSDINRKYRSLAKVQLFVYIGSTLNSQLQKTELRINYALAHALQIPSDVEVYTPILANKYDQKDCNATIIVFRDNVRHCTQLCKIEKNQIFIQ